MGRTGARVEGLQVTTDAFHAARALSERASANLYLAACRTFDDACMVSAVASGELFDASLAGAATERIEALAEAFSREFAYYIRARDFLDACQGEPTYVIRF